MEKSLQNQMTAIVNAVNELKDSLKSEDVYNNEEFEQFIIMASDLNDVVHHINNIIDDVNRTAMSYAINHKMFEVLQLNPNVVRKIVRHRYDR